MLAVPLLLSLALTGCGGSGDDDGIATAGGVGASPTASGGTGEKLTDDERRLKFAECMRGQGIDMPDPGQGQQGGTLRFGENADPKKVDAALQQCKQYAPNGGESIKLDAEQLAKMREFAKCMRANGVPDFPDPDADGQVRIDKYRGVIGDPAMKPAVEKCRQFAPTRPGAGG